LRSVENRPIGITIIAILNIIAGIFGVIAGFEFISLSNVSHSGLNISIGGFVIGIAIFSFAVAYGLLKGRSWAWTISVILSTISVILNAVSIVGGNFSGIVPLIISGITLYYLYRPHVKAYFGKNVIRDSPPSPPF
jgi:hypothetical protein